MASNFSPAYSQMFQEFFANNYQASGKLRGTTMELHGLVGDAYKMKYMGAQYMDQHGAFGSDIPAKNVTTTAPVLSFSDYELKLAIDEFEQLNMNASVLNGYAKTHAKAIGRREDQFIIDAVVADATLTVAAGGANLTYIKLLEARSNLGLNEVDDVLHVVLHWNNMQALLQQQQATSVDYFTQKTLVDGTMDMQKFIGFQFHVIGNRNDEGGLPIDGANVRSVIVYAQDAVTLGYRMDPQVRTVQVENNARIETLSLMSAGAKVGDANGVGIIYCDET